jgi:hypothetical protein
MTERYLDVLREAIFRLAVGDPEYPLHRVLDMVPHAPTAPRDGDFDLLLRRAYTNGHRDGYGCGQEAGALGTSECEHIEAEARATEADERHHLPHGCRFCATPDRYAERVVLAAEYLVAAVQTLDTEYDDGETASFFTVPPEPLDRLRAALRGAG